jgi:hypothetical protein
MSWLSHSVSSSHLIVIIIITIDRYLSSFQLDTRSSIGIYRPIVSLPNTTTATTTATTNDILTNRVTASINDIENTSRIITKYTTDTNDTRVSRSRYNDDNEHDINRSFADKSNVTTGIVEQMSSGIITIIIQIIIIIIITIIIQIIQMRYLHHTMMLSIQLIRAPQLCPLFLQLIRVYQCH